MLVLGERMLPLAPAHRENRGRALSPAHTAAAPPGPAPRLQVNENNIRTLTAELLAYLNVCDLEFKPDLTNKICMLVQRYAPDKRWYIDTLVQVGAVVAGGRAGRRAGA